MKLKFHIVYMITLAMVFLSGCAIQPPKPFDYTAYKENRPRSILVLPPINNSPEVLASTSVLSLTTYPLAEGGYYVIPVTLASETFKENGLTEPTDIHATAPDKLQKIFGADAGLYITISKYGTSYQVINSETVVAASAKLVDLKTGKELWNGAATASSAEGQNQQQGGLLGALVSAVVKQIIDTATDHSYDIATITSARLLSPHPNGLLFGPRSPHYGKD